MKLKQENTNPFLYIMLYNPTLADPQLNKQDLSAVIFTCFQSVKVITLFLLLSVVDSSNQRNFTKIVEQTQQYTKYTWHYCFLHSSSTASRLENLINQSLTDPIQHHGVYLLFYFVAVFRLCWVSCDDIRRLKIRQMSWWFSVECCHIGISSEGSLEWRRKRTKYSWFFDPHRTQMNFFGF